MSALPVAAGLWTLDVGLSTLLETRSLRLPVLTTSCAPSGTGLWTLDIGLWTLLGTRSLLLPVLMFQQKNFVKEIDCG